MHGPNAAQTIETSAARLTWVRNPDTEMECCSSVQGITGFARGEGIWSRLSVASRREQLEQMIELADELYPTFRWFLYDGMRRYAPPVTVFGPQRAALYLGQLYLVLTSAEHVRTLIHNLDGLIKVASVEPPKVPPSSPASAATSTADPKPRSVCSRWPAAAFQADSSEAPRSRRARGALVRFRQTGRVR